jgi:hypothetical protein
MTHENQVNGNNTIAFLKVEDIDDGNFIPTEVFTLNNVEGDIMSIKSATALYQCFAGNNLLHQYITATVIDSTGENDGIWYRIYSANEDNKWRKMEADNISEWDILHNSTPLDEEEVFLK